MSEVSESLRVRQRQARHSDILEAAWSLLSERGYAGWTLADLADRAGVSRRTLYLHFSSKEEIAAETVARNLRLTAERVRAVAAAEPLTRLKAVVRWFIDRSAEPRPIPVAPIKAEPGLMDIIRSFPSYQAAYSELIAVIAELIGRAQESGGIAGRVSPDVLSKLLLQLLRGVDAARWKETSDLGELVVATVFGGLGGRA